MTVVSLNSCRRSTEQHTNSIFICLVPYYLCIYCLCSIRTLSIHSLFSFGYALQSFARANREQARTQTIRLYIHAALRATQKRLLTLTILQQIVCSFLLYFSPFSSVRWFFSAYTWHNECKLRSSNMLHYYLIDMPLHLPQWTSSYIFESINSFSEHHFPISNLQAASNRFLTLSI